MSGNSEITSTEKLLEVIRGRADRQIKPEDQAVSVPPPAPTALLPSFKDSRFPVVVGVDIGLDSLRLVKAAHRHGKAYIIAARRTPFPCPMSRDSDDFLHLLRSELVPFCGSDTAASIWAVMSSVDVDVRHIRIPKVPKKQIEDAVYWTVKREMPFDEKERILDFEVQNEVLEKGVPKISVMVYTSQRAEVERIRHTFSESGIPLSGISITPFAIQNLFRADGIPASDKPVANLFIGRDFSRIDFFAHGNLVLTREIKAGTNSMIEAVMDSLNQPGASASTYEEARNVLYGLGQESISNSGHPSLGNDAVFDIIRPTLDRLIRQVERTFEHNAASFEREQVNKIYISSVMNIYMPMVDFIAGQLGLEGEVLDISRIDSSLLPPELKGVSVSDRSAFVPAIGLAMSDNSYTPNFLFTYKERKLKDSVNRINQVIFVAFITIVLLCSAIYAYQGFAASEKKKSISALRNELAGNFPLVSRDLFVQAAANVSRKNQDLKLYAGRYLGMAVINELSTLTPKEIGITGVKIGLGNPPSTKKTDGVLHKSAQELVIEGVAYGEQSAAETILSGYILTLDGSAIFDQINVRQTRFEKAKAGTGIYFTLGLKIGQVS